VVLYRRKRYMGGAAEGVTILRVLYKANTIRRPSPAGTDVARWGVFTARYANDSGKLRNCQLTICTINHHMVLWIMSAVRP
jgi:hypothetical protein